MLQLIDTHTHFDVEDFDLDRQQLAEQAYQSGVKALVLIGFIASRFDKLIQCNQKLQQLQCVPRSLLAPGLHPFYIEQHLPEHLLQLERILITQPCVAIGEIGLDSFIKAHKQQNIRQLQAQYFSAQLELATIYQKPVLLHIRKSHAETIQLLKQHQFKQGGIAHAFSGGVEEAKALIKLGFKIGITGQITNPNAKRLHEVVGQITLDDLVLETDCPDMTPLCCQNSTEHRTRNTPGNLPYVLAGLAEITQQDQYLLAQKLWWNSLEALHLQAL
ncbi:TatD family deoxyribonuclease [Acinetobacter qingfengensis]|uniref:Hydrolase n=1 Tax=Acinetobacter qingfengensis TaxID=1262585 RepID=A0A1E7RAP9_9GAMM|nr:TatD family hydrolase [Acinetobacter qingfengensis]KAA8734543.1 TatD family deoxyribonuclease [Acinetobacter qingfengensis]OEY96406.1 hydrolase [Acinetobacter qingfengensis]